MLQKRKLTERGFVLTSVEHLPIKNGLTYISGNVTVDDFFNLAVVGSGDLDYFLHCGSHIYTDCTNDASRTDRQVERELRTDHINIFTAVHEDCELSLLVQINPIRVFVVKSLARDRVAEQDMSIPSRGNRNALNHTTMH